MPISTFMGLQTALRGILAQQRALDTTAHNIANANTVGYTRQEAQLVASEAYTYPAVSRPPQSGQIGTGVDVASFRRIRDAFIDIQLRAQTLRRGFADATRDGLNQVELALAEPSDTGLNALLAKYWSAWQDVANAPENLATRQSLAQAAASLAEGFNTLDEQLDTIVAQTGQNVTLTMTEVNDLGAQIRELNDTIARSQLVGDQPNDLLDQRDLLLDRLAEIGDVQSTDADDDGALEVTLDGVTLVDDLTAYTLTESSGDLVNATLTETVSLTGKSGSLAGLVQLRDVTLPAYQTTLDDIASEIVDQTNTLHAAGYDLGGNTGIDFFDPAGTTAGTIAVDAGILGDASTIAAAGAWAGSGEPGNAVNALAIAGLRSTGLASLGGATIDTAYSQLVTRIGSESRDAQRTFDNASLLADSLENRRQSVSGVSLDEEMTGLVRFQRAYQASARALSAMDEMIEILVNRTGRVGL